LGFLDKPVKMNNLVQMKTKLLSLMLLLGTCAASAQVQLVTAEEAGRPDQQIVSTRAISRGPTVKLLSNTTVDAKSFLFKIAMEPKGGAQLDNHSFKIEYLKIPPVELTERVKFAFAGNLLTIPVTAVPKGAHAFKVSIKDTDGREGHAVISLDAK
jgi:hypothetical protein